MIDPLCLIGGHPPTYLPTIVVVKNKGVVQHHVSPNVEAAIVSFNKYQKPAKTVRNTVVHSQFGA